MQQCCGTVEVQQAESSRYQLDAGSNRLTCIIAIKRLCLKSNVYMERSQSSMTTVTHCCVRVCIADSCRRDTKPVDQPRSTTTSLPPPRRDPDHSSPFQSVRPSTTPIPRFPFDVHYQPEDADDGDELIRFDDDDDEEDDESSGGNRPSRTRPGRGRPQTGSPSFTGSSILSDDVKVDGRPRVFPAPHVHTTSGGRGHQRHVVSVTSSSTSGSGVVRLSVVTSFLMYALAAAASFHRAAILTVYWQNCF